MNKISMGGSLNEDPLRLVFYDDTPVYGGHEVMILNALRHMVHLDVYKIAFIYSPSNGRLETELKELRATSSKFSIVPFPYASGRHQFLRTLWAAKPLRLLRQILRGLRPDCLVVGQGEISISSLATLAGKLEAIHTVSYVPIAFTRQQRGEHLGGIKDAILSRYYQLPHRFVTICESSARMLRERGAKQPIEVVENGVDLSALRTIDRASARTQLGLSQDNYIAALCGRIESQTKGHDVLLHALRRRTDEFSDWIFLIVGDGPDKRRLEAKVKEFGLNDRVRFIAWQASMPLVYSAIDMVVMPSRYEGMSVVMLEAMYCGLPIVASAVGAMADLLPPEWLFPFGDERALAAALLCTRSQHNDTRLESNKRLVEKRFTIERQQLEFARALNGCLDTSAG